MHFSVLSSYHGSQYGGGSPQRNSLFSPICRLAEWLGSGCLTNAFSHPTAMASRANPVWDKEKASTNRFPNTASFSPCAAPADNKVLLSQGKLQAIPIAIYFHLPWKGLK